MKGIAFWRLIIAGIVGIFLGGLGIHDFIVKRGRQGAVHLALCAATLAGTPLIISGMMCDAGCDTGHIILAQLLVYIGVVASLCAPLSAIWGVVESVQILIAAKRGTKR